MTMLVKTPMKAKYISFLRIAVVAAILTLPVTISKAGYFGDSTIDDSGLQTIYTETPVESYYAYPDDVNFVPESEFMQRTDSLDYDDNIVQARDAEYTARPGVQFTEHPAVVCRNFGCTRLNDKITRAFLFNSLANMFMLNSNSRLYICEADPFNRSCLQSGISLPARIGVANAIIKIPKASVSQVEVSTGLSKASVGLTYEVLVNGISRQCDPTYADIVVPGDTNAVLAHREFSCNMTSDGETNVSLLVNIDYIDLDYGILGGYYSLGIQGPTSGGGTGYLLFKTEYANRGVRMNAASQTIRPGEYSVEPCKRIEPVMSGNYDAENCSGY